MSECRFWLGSVRVWCTVYVYVCVCMRVLTVARKTECPGVVLGSCPNQETQARCPVQRSSSDKKAISVSYSVLSFPPFFFL